MNYLYNGVKLPEPPLGFSGHMLLLYDNETSQYVLCYGSFYRYPFDPKPIVSPSASLPTGYAIKAGGSQCLETTIMPDAGSAEWTLVASADEYIWTNMDIYWLDSQTASNPTAEVAYKGTTAVLAPDEPEPEPEPGPEPEPIQPDSRAYALMQGFFSCEGLKRMRK